METKEKSKNIPSNYLQEDFQSIFLYTYNLQRFMGSCRVSIKNNIVTPPTIPEKCYTIICMLLTIGSCYVTIPVILEILPDRSVTALGISVLASMFLASFCNVIHVRFGNGNANADFLIKIHKLDRLMTIEKRKSLNLILKRINVFSALGITLAFILIILFGFFIQRINGFAFIGLTIYLLSFILELVMCSGLVIFFFVRVRFVNFMIESYMKREENIRQPPILSRASTKIVRFEGEDIVRVRFVNFMIESYMKREENIRQPPILSRASIKIVRFEGEDTSNYFATSDIHNYLKEIFNCFEMFQNLYRFQLLLFCIKLVVISLMSFELMLYLVSNNMFSGTGQVSILMVFMIIDSFIAAFLAFRFGIFFGEVKETKRLCIAVMALHHDGLLRKKAKTMLNIIDETPPRFSIYDMWDMNAGIFVTIFSLVTSLIVTLIQFAFL